MQALIPVIGLAVNVAFQIVSFRFLPPLGLLRSIALGFLAGLLALFAVEISMSVLQPGSRADMLIFFCVDGVTYVCLGYCYWAYINLGETSLRIRILRELQESQESLSMEELRSRYNPDEMFERRIQRLVKHGQVMVRGGRYVVDRPLLLLLAKMVGLVRFVIFGRFEENRDLN